jgi:hypothetical protein
LINLAPDESDDDRDFLESVVGEERTNAIDEFADHRNVDLTRKTTV